MYNILYSTTRQWNVGDEFIHKGIKNVIEEIYGKPRTSTIHNRNPQVKSYFNFFTRKIKYTNGYLSHLDMLFNIFHYDNSWKDGDDVINYDMVVFAGSPEWFGGRLKELYKKLRGYDGKIYMLGIGLPNRKIKLSSNEIEVMKRAKITVRNAKLKDILDDYGIKSEYITCPAILSSSRSKEVNEIKKIGLGYSTYRTYKNHAVDKEFNEKLIQSYKYLSERKCCSVICHYIDEYNEACKLFGNENVEYSYDVEDYFQIYNRFDLVVSPRVHGCGISSSLGIPNIGIIHDKRGETVMGFGSKIIERSRYNDKILIDEIDRIDIKNESVKINKIKSSVRDEYIKLLTK